MPWWTWVSVAAVYVAVWRVTFRILWEDYATPNWNVFWKCVFDATFLFWLIGLILALNKTSKRIRPDQIARVVGGESHAYRRRRRELELRELETRLHMAEQELGLESDAVAQHNASDAVAPDAELSRVPWFALGNSVSADEARQGG